MLVFTVRLSYDTCTFIPVRSFFRSGVLYCIIYIIFCHLLSEYRHVISHYFVTSGNL